MKIKRKHSIPESYALFTLREWCTLASAPLVAVSSNYLVSSVALNQTTSHRSSNNSILNCGVMFQNFHCFD